ncbi:MAG: phosphatidylserine decarboxylase [Candidatus Roizmanbacteria bacterium]
MIRLLTFWKEFIKNHQEVGALFATSKYASIELARHTIHDKKDHRTILEVGAGDGPVTRILIPNLRAGDTLWVVELNKRLMANLERVLSTEIHEARSRGAIVHLYCEDIRGVTAKLDAKVFDHIISTLPFNGLPAGFVKQVMSEYMRILKPGGEVSYIEYIFLLRLKRLFVKNHAHDQYMRYIQDRYLSEHAYVWSNLPPAHIHTLRFDLEHAPYELHHTFRVSSLIRINTAAQKYIFGSLGSGIALSIAMLMYRYDWIASIAMALGLLLTALFARFFRDSSRSIVQEQDDVYAPVDGTVTEIGLVSHPEHPATQVMRVGIFMSVFDQHIIRIPTSGVITEEKEIGSGHRLAYQPDASHNAGKLLMITPNHAPKYEMALLTGFLARRVALFFEPQTALVQGERIGVIHFGSRVDVYLPSSYKVASSLSVGQRVIAGHTIIAHVGGSGDHI